MEFSLLARTLVAVAAVYGVLWFEARRGSAGDCTRSLWDTALAGAMAGLLAGRLAAMVIAGTNPVSRPADVIIIRGGVDTVWAAVAAMTAVAVLARREFLIVADALAAPALAGLAGWHGACLATEACLGAPSALPWAMTLPGSTVTRHPVELYAAVLYAVATVGVLVWRRRRPTRGTIAFAGLAAAAGVRLATEPLRPVIASGLEVWYALGLVAGLAGVVTISARSKRLRLR